MATLTAHPSTLYFVNPHAGGGRAGQFWNRNQRAAGPTRDAIHTASAADSADQLRARLDEGVRRIIAVGGDGTFHLLVNEVLARGLGGQVDIGLVPMGTGSDLARTLRLPRNPHRAMALMERGCVRQLDALRLALDGEVRYATNIGSIGLSGEVAREVNRHRRHGRLGYLVTALRHLLGSHPRQCRVTVDDRPWYEGAAWLVALANGPRFARGMRIAPEAHMDDGLLDCVVVAGASPWRLLPWIPALYLGRHLRSPFISSTRGASVRVVTTDGDPWVTELDGEPYTARELQATVLPRALRMLTTPH